MKLTNKTLKKFILEFLEEQVSEDSKKEVQEAFNNTSEDYLSKSLQQRNPGQQSAGSTFKEPQTPDSLKNADWKQLSHNPEAIKDPAKGFEAPIAGFLGALDIKEVPDELDAVIQPAHAGKGIHRQTGKLMAELAAVLPGGQPSTDFTTLIIGPTREDPKKNQIYTFHPGAPFSSGEPIFMQDMKTKFNTEEDVIPVKIKDAKELGFELVKHVSSLPVTKTLKENKMKLTRQKLKQFIKEELSQVKENYYGWGAEWDPHTDQPGGGSGLGREEETPSPSPSKSLKSGDKCPDCHGRGVQELEQWDSQMLTMVPYDTVECPRCKGTGKVLEEKLTRDKLQQIVREQLEEIEEGLFDKAVGAVTGAAKGAVSGFKQGGVKGAIAGAQQQAASEAEKKSLQGDFTKLVNLAKEMQKQSAKDPKIAQVSKQLGYFLNSIKSNLEKLGVQTPATGMYEQQAQPQQPQSTVGKAKEFASAVGTAVSDRMKRTPIVAAADSLLTSIIKMQKAAGQDQAKLQILDKIQTDLNNILKHLGSVGQHSAVIKTQQTPVQEKRITRDTLNKIIKEELEEAYRDPYGSLSKRFSSNRSYGYDRGKEINVGLGPEDFAPQPQSTKPGRSPDKHGSTNVPVEQRIPLASKLFDIGSKLNQQGSEDGPKIMGLGNLISSLETGDTSLLKHYTNSVNKDGGVNTVLDLVQDPELKQKVKDLLDQKQIQENKKKLTRKRLEQIIKEQLQEMAGSSKTIEDVILGTYQGQDYAADEDENDLKKFKLYDPVTLEPIEPAIVIPKLEFETDWSKTNRARADAVPASKRKSMQKKPKPAPKWAKGYI